MHGLPHPERPFCNIPFGVALSGGFSRHPGEPSSTTYRNELAETSGHNSRMGYRVFRAASIEETVSRVQDPAFDLVVSDKIPEFGA